MTIIPDSHYNILIGGQELMRKSLSFLGVIFLFYGCNLFTDPEEAEPMTDLVIKDIKYYRQTYIDTLWGGSWQYIFFIDVLNVGDRETSSHFYISNTRTDNDYHSQHFSHTEIINYDNDTIWAGEIFTDSIYDAIPEQSEYLLFKIRGAIDTTREGEILPYVQESDYGNNLYTLHLVYD